MSDIRVSVQWKSSTVFAGEDIECTITFKNFSQPSNLRRSPSPSTQLRRHGSSRERWKETLPHRSIQGAASYGNKIPPSMPSFPHPYARSHKPALSLSTSNGPPAPTPSTSEAVPRARSSENNAHRRSVSIVSIGGDTIDEAPSPGPILSSGRPIRGHVRAASLQFLPRRASSSNGGSSSARGNDRAFTVPSSLFHSSSYLVEQKVGTPAAPRSKQQAGPGINNVTPTSSKQNRIPLSRFKLPQAPSTSDKARNAFISPSAENPLGSLNGAHSPRPYDAADGLEQPKPATRVLSPASINATPRSSGEFYSMSNNSTDTMASEYITHESSRSMHRLLHSRQGSYLAPTTVLFPEVLMMGYAQIVGSFALDGSLINQSPFEEAKKKGIISGQGGGGVVRNESTKRDSGLLGSFGWSNIGESLGGLLGGNELSSIKEAKSSPNARSIPILTTPQSILFVDLRLGPGESRSYSYRHPLPKGIPPSHKGRAIKIAYGLIVGTQRAAKISQQHRILHADIPFRVLTSVNDEGEILGHDLMSPHTILSDIASISSVENLQHVDPHPREGLTPWRPTSSCPEFLSYVGSLLDRSCRNSGPGLLSPTEPESRSLTPTAEGSDTMKDAIDLAILKSNAATSYKRSANRFEIARSGERVAVIMLARPAYRLGETIRVAIDLEESDLQCYSLHATLETLETIDPAIALRSKASIHRVTRRIHASQTESTIAAKKVLFNPMIPSISTPDFITSSISLDWILRFDFVTSCIRDAGELKRGISNLMEEVARDERGSVQAAVQGLTSESFDVTVPLRVYGATAGFDKNNEVGDFPI